MKISMLGRALAALLPLSAATAAQAGGYYGGGGGSVTGGNCATQQAANGVSSTGAPTGCLPVPLVHPGFVAGQWYNGMINPATFASATSVVAGTAYCGLFYLPYSKSLTDIGTGINTAGGTGGTATLAIYTNDTTVSPYRPGALVAYTGNIADTSAGNGISGTTFNAAGTAGPVPVTAAWYWHCAEFSDTTVRYKARNSGDAQMLGAATLNAANAGTYSGVSVPQTYGTWPASLSGSTWSDAVSANPLIRLQ